MDLGRRFKWLIAICVLVGILEFLSLGGISLPKIVLIPLCTAIVIGIGSQTFSKGLRALSKLDFKNINLLMVIAFAGAFYLGKYEEGTILISLYALSEKLEEYGINRSKSFLHELLKKIPQTVFLKGSDHPVQIAEVKVGDIMIVKPYEMIGCDGVVRLGSSFVDESSITGESLPSDKFPGDPVYAGSLNKQGYLEVEITKKAEDSSFEKIYEITKKALKHPAKPQKFIEQFAKYYTPWILILAIFWLAIQNYFFNIPFQSSLLSALALIVIACPCALVISTPMSIFSALGNASSHGVLIKGGQYLEALGRCEAMAFDKTRTLTYGKPIVTDVIPFGNVSKYHLLACAAGIETFSEHPIAQGVLEEAKREKQTPHEIANFESIVGKGVRADCLICEDAHHCIGKLQFILEEHEVPEEVLKTIDALQNQGKTVIVVSTKHHVEGIIALADQPREESRAVIHELKKMDIEPFLLSGDHEMPAKLLAQTIGIENVYAELLPAEKVEVLHKYQKKFSSVGMVGDGVNDAPALASANFGISMSGLSSDTAIETASIVLLQENLKKIPYLIKLGRRSLRTIKFNIFLAVSVKIVFIVLALTGYSNLALAIFADVGITLIVILNSLNLLKNY